MMTNLEHDKNARFLAAYEQLPDNFKLSIYFTLADLVRKKQIKSTGHCNEDGAS